MSAANKNIVPSPSTEGTMEMISICSRERPLVTHRRIYFSFESCNINDIGI